MQTQQSTPQLCSVIDAAYKIGMLQRRKELEPFCTWLSNFHIKNFCEIGVWHGASFTIWDALSEPGEHIAIDPNSQQGIILTPQQLAARQNRFSTLKPTVSMLMMDSQRASTRQAVEDILDCQKLDLLFIDGDHSQHACYHDYIVYGQFMRKGGVIALHDVDLYPGCKTIWRDLSAHNPNTKHWVDPHETSGIGAIIVD